MSEDRKPDPLDKRWFEVSADEYDRIQFELSQPPKPMPRLADLLAEEPEREAGK